MLFRSDPIRPGGAEPLHGFEIDVLHDFGELFAQGAGGVDGDRQYARNGPEADRIDEQQRKDDVRHRAAEFEQALHDESEGAAPEDVPMFIGFVSAGVPLGVTFSFLISAPMVNEVALGLLFGLVGWKVALTYLVFGLIVAIVSGWVIGRLHLEHWLQEWVRNIRSGSAELPPENLSIVDRLKAGIDAVYEIVGKVWPWIVAGIAAGAFIHGYVPADLLASIMRRDAWWSVPAVVLIGIPMYSNAAGIIPVVTALLAKGAALGTVLAFMMSVIALSLPEMIILRKVLTTRLIAVFVGVVGSGILAVGFLFNFLFQ